MAFKNNPTADKLEELRVVSINQAIKRDLDQEFYNTFRESKRHDLQKEYQDIPIHTFKLSGLISFENTLINFSSRELDSFVFKDLEIVGDLNDEAFVQNLSTSEFLGFDAEKISELKKT